AGQSPRTGRRQASDISCKVAVVLPCAGPSEPRVLPHGGDASVVATVADVGAVAETESHRLMQGEGNGRGEAEARIPLIARLVRDSVYGGLARGPVVHVERHPEARADVVAQVPLERRSRTLRERSGTREIRVVREVLCVVREEPHRAVGIEDPVSP